MRRPNLTTICLVATILLVSVGSLVAQEFRPLSATLLEKIPVDLREQARLHVSLTEQTQNQWQKQTPDQLRASVIRQLTDDAATIEFMLDLLPKEPAAANRLAILNAIPYRAHWKANARTRTVLSGLVAADKDVEVVKLALETLRFLEIEKIRGLLAWRLNAEQETGSTEFLNQLAEVQERWASLQRGSMLPGFMRVVPPVFTVKLAGKPIRIVAFGDFGRGTPDQKRIADAMNTEHRRTPFDFGITLGDNFYPSGMDSPNDPRWQTYWEQLYSPLKINFYASLGNHDWFGYDSVAAELVYAEKSSSSWQLPAPYYSFTAGPVQLFAVDTDDMGVKQQEWLRRELAKTSFKWKIVYGHHPVYAASTFGKSYTENIRPKLLPIIRGKADLYVCGHHHSLQHLQPDGGTHFLIIGGGGASTYPVGEKDEERGQPALFASSAFGFGVIDADRASLVVRFFLSDGTLAYSYLIRK